LKLPAIDLQGTLGKVPGLSKFIKPKAGASAASGGAKGKAAPVKSHEQEVQQRLDLTMKGLGGLALVLVLFALYTVFSQNGLNKAILTAAPPMVDLSELVPSAGGKAGSGKGDPAKEAKAANNAKVKLPEGTDPRIDYAFEQLANFENTRSEAVLRGTRANVAGVAPGSVAARAGFRPGDFILSVDGEQAGFVWDSLRKLTAAGKSAVLLEVQRGNEVLRGELMAPEGETITSSNTGLLFEIPEGYRFIGENDRRDLRSDFSRVYMEGLAGDERLAYATSLALLGGNLVKRGVEQANLKPADPMWLKTEQILADHHSKFSKALAHHGTVLESMQASLQAGFVKIGALLLAALIAGIAAVAAALQLNKHLSDQGIAALRAQFQGLRSQVDQLAHAGAASSSASRSDASASSRPVPRQGSVGPRTGENTRSSDAKASDAEAVSQRGPSAAISAVGGAAAAAAGMSLAELAARVALSSDADEDNHAEGESERRSVPQPASFVQVASAEPAAMVAAAQSDASEQQVQVAAESTKEALDIPQASTAAASASVGLDASAAEPMASQLLDPAMSQGVASTESAAGATDTPMVAAPSESTVVAAPSETPMVASSETSAVASSKTSVVAGSSETPVVAAEAEASMVAAPTENPMVASTSTPPAASEVNPNASRTGDGANA